MYIYYKYKYKYILLSFFIFPSYSSLSLSSLHLKIFVGQTMNIRAHMASVHRILSSILFVYLLPRLLPRHLQIKAGLIWIYEKSGWEIFVLFGCYYYLVISFYFVFSLFLSFFSSKLVWRSSVAVHVFVFICHSECVRHYICMCLSVFVCLFMFGYYWLLVASEC